MGQSTTGPQATGGLTLDTTRLALIYPRQSSAHQLEQNVYSLENQLLLRDRAIVDGFPAERVVVIDDDLGKSARTITARVGMTRALALIDEGLVGALYAEDQTRLSRDVDTVDHMAIGKRCRLARVPIFYGGSWRDLTDRGTRLAYKVEAVIGSEMWGGHLEKMHASQRLKAERGQAATQIVRWGYRLNRDVPRRHPDRDKLIVHEAEAAVIRTLVAQLTEAGSVRELYRRNHPIYWPDGRPMTYRTLVSILHHPVYRGIYTWSDVAIEGAHEAIIGPADAAMIDAQAERNRAVKRGPTDGAGGVLLGLTWCPTCHRRIYHSRSNQRPDYRCQVKDPSKPADNHFCVQSHLLDDLVVADLWRRMAAGLIDAVTARLEDERAAQRVDVDLTEAGRRAVERQIEGLTRTLADPDVTPSARKVLLAQLDRAAREQEALSRPRTAAPRLDAELSFYRELRKDPDFLAALPGAWEDEPIAWQRTWIARFLERVEVLAIARGRFEVTIIYRDGLASRLALTTRPGVTDEELDLVRALWDHPDRPGQRWGAWMGAELAAAGFPRTSAGVLRIVDIARNKRRRKKAP